MWPNRCVAEMIAFTDTLKDIGEMKEGEKDSATTRAICRSRPRATIGKMSTSTRRRSKRS